MTTFMKAHHHDIRLPPRSSRTRSMDNICDYRWPDRFAKYVADRVRREVEKMLCESRLTRKNQHGIDLVHRGDIVCVDRVLGTGSFSQVSAVTAKNGRRYACKHLQQKLMENPQDFQLAATELALEAHILSSFDHPNIIKIRGWAANGIASFECGKHDSFFLMLDLLDETLDARISRWRDEELHQFGTDVSSSSLPTLIPDDGITSNPFLDLESTKYNQNQYLHPYQPRPSRSNKISLRLQRICFEKSQIIADIASALSYIHAQGVIFRDLKPQNVGFSAETNTLKIFDFGLSRELPSLDTSTPFSMSGKVGTLRYMAPEVVTNQPYNISSDVYSWAIVSYELLSLEKPFDGWTRDLHEDLVCARGIRPKLSNTLHPISEDMRVILEQAWSPIPSNRGTMSQIYAQLQCSLSNQITFLTERKKFNGEFQERNHQELLGQLQQQQIPVSAVGVSPITIPPCESSSFYIDNMPSLSFMSEKCDLASSTFSPTRISRSMSLESIETINTSSLSVEIFPSY